MINIDVLKTTVEDDLKGIAKRKLDILILQRQNETLCKDNNEKIKELTEDIKSLELSLEDNLSKSGERKIETPAGWCAYRAMPDSWGFLDSDIIEWCKHEGLPYYHTIEVLKKMDLKKAVLNGEIDLKDVPGLTVTTQEPKFNYKLNSGGELL